MVAIVKYISLKGLTFSFPRAGDIPYLQTCGYISEPLLGIVVTKSQSFKHPTGTT